MTDDVWFNCLSLYVGYKNLEIVFFWKFHNFGGLFSTKPLPTDGGVSCYCCQLHNNSIVAQSRQQLTDVDVVSSKIEILLLKKYDLQSMLFEQSCSPLDYHTSLYRILIHKYNIYLTDGISNSPHMMIIFITRLVFCRAIQESVFQTFSYRKFDFLENALSTP